MSRHHPDAIYLSDAIHAAHISVSSYRAPGIAQAALAKAWAEGYKRGASYEYICQGLSLYGEPTPPAPTNPYEQEQTND